MTPLDDLKLSPTQIAVLRWLRFYPTVQIHWVGTDGDRPNIMPWWCDDEARKHMIGTMAILGKEIEEVASHPKGGTPPLRKATFNRLLRESLLVRSGSRAPQPHWSPMHYYTISDRGLSALLMLAKVKGSR